MFLFSTGLAVALVTAADATATAPPLGTSGNFAVLAGQAVTNTGTSVIGGDPTADNGNVGVSPGTAVTGFPPGTVTPPAKIHVNDRVAAQAQTDLTAAYTVAAGETPTTAVITSDLGGRTLTAGIYTAPSSMSIGTGQTGANLVLTLRGGPSDVFVFQAGTSLTTASASRVILIGGAQACNVFWQVGSSATLGTGSNFTGTVLALTSITVTTGATILGRVLARNGSVTLDADTITSPTCASVSTTTTTTPTTTTTTSPPTTSTTPSTTTTTTTTTVPNNAKPPVVPPAFTG